MCDVCVTYVWRILDSPFVSTAYQRRTCGVSRVSMAYVLRMCDVLGVLGIVCGIPRESLMLLYKCFRFSEIMDQMFLGPGWRAGFFQGYAWCSLCLYS